MRATHKQGRQQRGGGGQEAKEARGEEAFDFSKTTAKVIKIRIKSKKEWETN